MPAAEQLREAARQVAGLTVEELQGAAWRLHPRDHAALLEAGVDVVAALRLRVVIVADPDLEGRGPMLTWDEE